MRKTLVLSVILALLIGVTLAQAQAWRGKGRISGSVKDDGGNPIEGVVVKFDSSKLQSSTELKTDKKGNWLMAGIHGGMWTITFEKQGFRSKQMDWSIMEYEYNKPMEVVLDPAVEASTPSTGESKPPAGPDLSAAQAGRDLLAQKDYQGALAKFQEALTANPAVYQIYGDIATAQYQAGNLDEAIKTYELYLRKEKEAGVIMPDQQVMLAIVAVYMDKKDMASAKKYMEGIDEASITDPIIFFNLGVSSTNAGDIDSAIKYFEKSVQVDPKFVDGYYQLAISYVGKANNPKAIECFKKVIEIDPNSDSAKEAHDFIKMMGQ